MLPTAAEESRFWSVLAAAWEGAADLDAFLANLEALSENLSAEELTALDRVTERKLYDLDRVDVYTVVAGSDDSFLYRRGFIVAMGRDFYEAVLADPATYRGGSCEEMCYFFAHVHDDRFGDFPDIGTDISRETGGNPASRLD